MQFIAVIEMKSNFIKINTKKLHIFPVLFCVGSKIQPRVGLHPLCQYEVYIFFLSINLSNALGVGRPGLGYSLQRRGALVVKVNCASQEL